MAGFDGNGGWVIRYNFVADAAGGVKILASRQDQMWSDVQAGFQNCITRDGQGKPSANFNWNAKQINNVGPGTLATDAATLGDLRAWGQKPNLLFNPFFSVWQRLLGGSSIAMTAGGNYFADRWKFVRDTSHTAVTAYPQAGDTGNPFYTAAKIQRDSGNTDTVDINVGQSFEQIDARRIIHQVNNLNRKKTPASPGVLLAAYLKKGASFSAANVVLSCYSCATANLGPFSGTWNPLGSNSISASNLSTTVYTPLYCLLTNADISDLEGIKIQIAWSPTGTAGADDSLYITGAGFFVAPYIDQGAGDILATPTFSPALIPETYETELRRCKRYFQVFGGSANSIYYSDFATNASGGTWDRSVYLPVEMRASPTVTKNGTWAVTNCGQPSIPVATPTSFILRAVPTSQAWTSFYTDSADDYITLDADL